MYRLYKNMTLQDLSLPLRYTCRSSIYNSNKNALGTCPLGCSKESFRLADKIGKILEWRSIIEGIPFIVREQRAINATCLYYEPFDNYV